VTFDEAMLSYGALVARVLVPGADLDAAATAFTAPAEDDVEARLWAAWTVVIDAAADADEAGQIALVELITRVRRHDVEPPVRVQGRRVFGELPVFGAQLREAWNLVPPDGRTVESWTGLNAFAARLTAAGVADLLLFGLWSIGTALETFADVPAHLPAAVPWFRHCGPALVSATVHGRTYGGRSDRLHELAERAGLTAGGFNVPRWRFWRSRLQGLADAGDPAAREGLRHARRFDARIAAG
jgi:hypothetical protein